MKELIEILRYHANKYPKMRPEDAVKLIYQNEFGGAHMALDADVSLKSITDEMEAAPEKCTQALTEDIGNGYVRLNLCRAATDGPTPDAVNGAFYLSAINAEGNMESFKQKLAVLRENAALFGFTMDELEQFLVKYEADGCPVMSHSPEYKAEYNPSYRIVAAWMTEAWCAIDLEKCWGEEHQH